MSKFKLTGILILLMCAAFQPKAQNIQNKAIEKLVSESKNWFEGFQQNVGNNEFSYNSFRTDVRKSLLTRCTDGKMAIEWQTQVVPTGFDQSEAGFLWIAALDLTRESFTFDVFFNGQKRFEIHTSEQKDWQIKSPDGGSLSFVTVETDQNGDAHGYMSMVVPQNWLRKGQPQTVKIIGRAQKDNTWIIVYQANDALDFLQKSSEYDLWAELEIEKTNHSLQCSLKAPEKLSNTEISYSSSGKTKTLQLQESGGNAVGSFTLPLSSLNKAFVLKDSKGEIFALPRLDAENKTTRLQNKSVLFIESRKEGEKTILQANRAYEPKTSPQLLNLSNSILGKGQIYLMNSSHQDIAWMDSPEKCVIERDTMLITPLLEMGAKDKNYRFDLEDGLMLREYIARHPDKKPLVKEMLNDGRISCGSTYIQPYEEMYSGESLVRQFYLGAKWLQKEFGYNATVYWNEDVPGRTLQMAQLMRKAGTKYLSVSRHERGIYNWYSPDGSYVTMFSPGHYGDAFGPLQKKFNEASQYLAKSSMDWTKYYDNQTAAPIIPVLSDNDMSPAKDYRNLIQGWNAIRELQDEKGNTVAVKLPAIKVATAPEFFDALLAQKPLLPSISGERPDVWLYIHGPSHQKAIKASREADILLPVAEKLATINAVIDGSFKNYPETQLAKAWEAKIYPDHGWGGKHGDITDALFLQKYEFSKAEASQIIAQNLGQLAAKVITHPGKGRPLVVFNSMNAQRNDPVSIEVSFNPAEAFGLELQDAKGQKIGTQLSNAGHFSDGSIKRATLNFIAEQVPAIGFKTYYLKTTDKRPTDARVSFANEAENQFYKLKFSDGGLSSIFDKTLNQELIDPAKFKAGEVFTMHSFGNGAGEFIDIQKPDMDGFDKTGNYPTKWQIEENGPVYTVYKFRQHIRYADIELRVKVYNQLKRIDFEPSVLNWEGVLYREFRMALPLNMNDGQVAYEVPFGVVEVGKDELKGAAGERYTTICKEMHPRGIENWIGANNQTFGVTVSSSVAVADWIDPTSNPMKNQMLQPILLASRKSCHWEGNDYLQTGDHTFRFSFTSHPSGWINGNLFGREANEQLFPVWADHQLTTASLPESLSFFSTDQDKVLISTIKKSEDGDAAIFRLVDLEGKDKNLKLNCFRNITAAAQTNLIENPEKNLPADGNILPFELGHHAIETFRIETLK